MLIAGIQKNSFVDYENNIAACIFTSGCNMDCFYCHNKEILQKGLSNYDTSEILDFLENRKRFLDGVVISGGEPTLHSGLEGFLANIKKIGYPIKLDTNGTNPEILERLIKKGLVDYVAMDIKAPLNKYDIIIKTHVDMENLKKSIDILLAEGVDYEFRTTYVPELDFRDILDITQIIKGARLYVLQQYKNIYSEDFKCHTSEYILDTVKMIGDTVRNCKARGILL